MTPTERARFESRIDRSGGLWACWPWQGVSHGDGYGRLRIAGRIRYAHRLAFFLANGYLPEAVCHRCDNPPCVNPAHLRAGTLSDNCAEMWAKGRARVYPKLTSSQVARIQQAHPRGWAAADAFAAEFGVSRRTIQRLIGRGTPKCYQQPVQA